MTNNDVNYSKLIIDNTDERYVLIVNDPHSSHNGTVSPVGIQLMTLCSTLVGGGAVTRIMLNMCARPPGIII